MNNERIELVQSSFAKVIPIKEEAAVLFYERLFEIAPDVEPLFNGDMKEQGRKLMSTLAFVVNGLKDVSSIVPAVEDLARRHVGYGVSEEHYAPVGDALMWTLERGLGNAFTPEVKAAWVEAYTLLSDAMIGAAYEEAA